MRPTLPFLLTMLAAGCVPSEKEAPPASGDAMCHSLEGIARRHAAALAEDGGDLSVTSGQTLIAGLAAACTWKAPE